MRALRWLVLPLVVSTISAVGSVAGPTHALSGSRRPTVGQGFRSMTTADALSVDATAIDLGDLIAGSDVDRPQAVRVHNTSPGRTLFLAVTLTGAPGFTADVTPQPLPPGQMATIHIAGQPAGPGDLVGTLTIRAFGGFLHLDIPVRGHVATPPPPEPEGPAPTPIPPPEPEGPAPTPIPPPEPEGPAPTPIPPPEPEGPAPTPIPPPEPEGPAPTPIPPPESRGPTPTPTPPPEHRGPIPTPTPPPEHRGPTPTPDPNPTHKEVEP